MSYDVFEEGGKSIQVKNFGRETMVFRKGDRVPNEYPATCSFIRWANDRKYAVLIRNGVFIGITRRNRGLIHPLFNCDGGEVVDPRAKAL